MSFAQPNSRYHKRTPVTPLFPPGLSLECTEGDQESDLIEFTFDGRMWISTIDRINNPGEHNRSSPIPLYHSHVMWSYVLCQHRQLDGSFELSLRGCGPHIGCNVDDVFSVRNHPEGLTAPDLLAATGTFADSNGEEKETIEFAKDAAGHWTAPKRFTRDELKARTGSDGNTICILLRFVVARSYFTLSKLLKEPSTVSKIDEAVVKRILNGKKLARCDLEITVGSGGGDSPLITYHVESAKFSRISEKFKKACKTGCSINNQIMMSGPNRCTIPSLAPDDMPVLLSLAYDIDVPLPTNITRFGMLGRALTNLLDWKVVQDKLFPQWERAICKKALALDKHALSSFAALPRLLLTVWAAPYGFMPVAKRVAIGVFADMVWLQTPPGMSVADFLDPSVITAMGPEMYCCDMMMPILNSMHMHIEIVSAVRKIGLSMKQKHDDNNEDNDVFDEKEEEVNDDVTEAAELSHPTSPTKPHLDAPTVVPIEDDVDEEPEIESAKWQCTIS